MYYLYIATGFLIVLSYCTNRNKTFKALKIAYKKLKRILPAFLSMLILVSIILFFIPDQTISHFLGGSNIVTGMLLATFFGSITMMPGFIAFPLSGILLQKGVPYMIISAFTTTLMMVGILTYPIEKEYFGHKVTLIRNGISLLIALIIALIIGLCFREVL